MTAHGALARLPSPVNNGEGQIYQRVGREDCLAGNGTLEPLPNSRALPRRLATETKGGPMKRGFTPLKILALMLLVSSRASADETHAPGAHPAPIRRAPTAPRVI